ncbi:MAG: hypothetical protein U9Q33_11645 [Campylobacterota bacterium]|nr:hypothetical protein [Campylobacterota bacterium]
MYVINVNKECGCFKKSIYENNMKFDSIDEAKLQADLMVNYMNSKFCHKHGFELSQNDKTLQITMGEHAQSSSGCCGGGHCS